MAEQKLYGKCSECSHRVLRPFVNVRGAIIGCAIVGCRAGSGSKEWEGGKNCPLLK